jgi:hypothetical protein
MPQQKRHKLSRANPAHKTESTMKKVLILVLMALFAARGLTAQGDPAALEKAKKAWMGQAAGEARWSGSVVRTDKDASTLDVRKKGGLEKRIHFDSSTKWTKKGGGTIDPSQVKEDDRVICIGKHEGDKFIATEISLRTPK